MAFIKCYLITWLFLLYFFRLPLRVDVNGRGVEEVVCRDTKLAVARSKLDNISEKVWPRDGNLVVEIASTRLFWVVMWVWVVATGAKQRRFQILSCLMKINVCNHNLFCMLSFLTSIYYELSQEDCSFKLKSSIFRLSVNVYDLVFHWKMDESFSKRKICERVDFSGWKFFGTKLFGNLFLLCWHHKYIVIYLASFNYYFRLNRLTHLTWESFRSHPHSQKWFPVDLIDFKSI